MTFMDPIAALAEHVKMLQGEREWTQDRIDERLRKNVDDAVRVSNLSRWIREAEDAIEKLGGRVPA